MKPTVIIRPEAESEIKEAYLWYEERRTGLGADFILCVEDGLEKIRSNPEMYPVVYKNIRRLLIRRFPYGIFYLTQLNIIMVLAVFHSQRNPKQWQSRG
jgi:toxin ParE1/3/4